MEHDVKEIAAQGIKCYKNQGKWKLLRKIWQEQVLPIGNEQYSSLKSMTKEEVSASRRTVEVGQMVVCCRRTMKRKCNHVQSDHKRLKG